MFSKECKGPYIYLSSQSQANSSLEVLQSSVELVWFLVSSVCNGA